MTTITLLDGGTGREIKQRLPQWDPVLWSASGLIYDPALVCTIHREFIDAGAQVITTNNYMVIPYALEQCNRLSEFESLTIIAGRVAQQAKAQSGQASVRVAGCLPPLGTTYRSDLIETNSAIAVDTYTLMLGCLSPYVDLFIAESLSSLVEADQILAAYAGQAKPLYMAFLLDDDHPGQLLDGTPIQAVVDTLANGPVSAVLFNCCHPDTISATLRMIQNPAIPLGAYANAFVPLVESFNHGDARTRDESVTPTVYLDHVQQWLDHGVTLVGGCCGIGPDHIRAIANYLNQ